MFKNIKKDWATLRGRKAAKKRKDALAGKISSGNLDPGDRARLFRQRKK